MLWGMSGGIFGIGVCISLPSSLGLCVGSRVWWWGWGGLVVLLWLLGALCRRRCYLTITRAVSNRPTEPTPLSVSSSFKSGIKYSRKDYWVGRYIRNKQTLISNNTQISSPPSPGCTNNSNKSFNLGILSRGSFNVSKPCKNFHSQSIILSSSPKQRFKVASWDKTMTPSLERWRSVSMAWAPTEMAPLKAPSVFSGWAAL